MIGGCNAVVGQLAVSKRGRDRGEPYLVLEIIDDAFVYLVNGDRRRIENPKRKNVKHLQFYPAVAEHLAQQWEAGQQVGNVEVRKVIAGFMQTVVGKAGSETMSQAQSTPTHRAGSEASVPMNSTPALVDSDTRGVEK